MSQIVELFIGHIRIAGNCAHQHHLYLRSAKPKSQELDEGAVPSARDAPFPQVRCKESSSTRGFAGEIPSSHGTNPGTRSHPSSLRMFWAQVGRGFLNDWPRASYYESLL